LPLLLWLGRKIVRAKTERPGVTGFWVANFIVSVLFAIGHIPAAQTIMKGDAACDRGVIDGQWWGVAPLWLSLLAART
jgi:membrane protease YdiL (CAAX protease family)